MFTSHKQISPPSLVLKLKISEVSQKWIPKAVELKRIPTHKKCKCKKFCSQTRLVGEIYSSDVIMHRGYYRCCLRFSYLAPYLLISPNTITFHKYFWCSRFCELHSNVRNTYRFSLAGITSFIWGSPQVSNYQREWKAQINKKHLDNKTSYRWGTRLSFTVWKAL